LSSESCKCKCLNGLRAGIGTRETPRGEVKSRQLKVESRIWGEESPHSAAPHAENQGTRERHTDPPIKEITIKLEKSGFKAWETTLTVTAGTTATVNPTLDKE